VHSRRGAEDSQRGTRHRVRNCLGGGRRYPCPADGRAAGPDEEHRTGEDRAGLDEDPSAGEVAPVFAPDHSSRPGSLYCPQAALCAVRVERYLLRSGQDGVVHELSARTRRTRVDRFLTIHLRTIYTSVFTDRLFTAYISAGGTKQMKNGLLNKVLM